MNTLKIEPRSIGRDMLAGLIAAIAAIPDGMASATLAGVNPVYGLYNLMLGTPVAALFTSSVYMAVINTSAMALVVLDALAGYAGDEQIKAFVTLTVLVGLFQLILALFKLGYLTRFVSNSVMRGFLTGIGIIGLVQATGVSQAYANPDGKYPDPDGDFRGQGLANAAAGLFQGIPLGGSVSGTAFWRCDSGRALHIPGGRAHDDRFVDPHRWWRFQ